MSANIGRYGCHVAEKFLKAQWSRKSIWTLSSVHIELFFVAGVQVYCDKFVNSRIERAFITFVAHNSSQLFRREERMTSSARTRNFCILSRAAADTKYGLLKWALYCLDKEEREVLKAYDCSNYITFECFRVSSNGIQRIARRTKWIRRKNAAADASCIRLIHFCKSRDERIAGVEIWRYDKRPLLSMHCFKSRSGKGYTEANLQLSTLC